MYKGCENIMNLEHFDYIMKNYDFRKIILKLFKNQLWQIWSDEKIIDYMKYIVNKCQYINENDTEIDVIYKYMVLSGSFSKAATNLAKNDIKRKYFTKGHFRYSSDEIFFIIRDKSCSDPEIDLFAKLLLSWQYEINYDYIEELKRRIYEMYQK